MKQAFSKLKNSHVDLPIKTMLNPEPTSPTGSVSYFLCQEIPNKLISSDLFSRRVNQGLQCFQATKIPNS